MSPDDQSASGKMKRIVEGQNGRRISFELLCQREPDAQPARHVGNVLVVDDESAICELLSLYLGFKGLVVKTCQTPVEALDAFSQMAFDLAILDWNLAGVESLDVLNYFKAIRPEMAVIVFTGKEVDESFLQKALAGRADVVLPKLGSLDSLWQHISHHLEKTKSGGTNGSRHNPSHLQRGDI